MQEGGEADSDEAVVSYSDEDVYSYIQGVYEGGGGNKEIADAMDKYSVSAEQVARVSNLPTTQVQGLYDAAKASGAPAPAEPSEKSTVSPVTMQVQPEETISAQELPEMQAIEAEQADVPQFVQAPAPVTPTKVEAERVTAEDLGQADAARGEIRPEALVGDIQGEVSQEALAEGITGVPSPEATVKFQMADLMKSIEEGEPLPPWAAPAARAVGAVMQQRGLGASSMASAAMTQAILEAGIPIASQDAQTYAQFDLQSLNNRQQAALQNAATYAQMDMANLDARLQAAVTNAKSFLSIDLQNLTNDQRTRELNYQTNAQRMFTNQAAENAAQQFNAQTQTQVDMFFTELATQVETANANRTAAAEQFNVSQVNATRQFNQSIQNQRDQFNANMGFQVESSNAQWRRTINTQNTAAQNRANEFNAANAFSLEAQRQQNLWQEYRDELAWANTSAENAQARDHEITLYALQKSATLEYMDKETEEDVWRRIGAKVVDKVL